MRTRLRSLRGGTALDGRSPRLRRAHLAVVLTGLVAAAATLAALRDAQQSVGVLVWARPVAVGERLGPDDVVTARVHAEPTLLATLLTSPARLVGTVAQVRGEPGAPVRSADVAASHARSAVRTMSFPVPQADAVAGNLVAGDRVDVVAAGRDGARVGFAVVDAVVRAVDRSDGLAAAGTQDATVVLTVEVGPDDALRLVAAQSVGKFVVVRSTGARRVDDPLLLDATPSDSEVLP